LFAWVPDTRNGPYRRSLYRYFSEIAREKPHDPDTLVAP
jgi:hypothetical protein